jgi:diacylglycerol kinase (ATP)
MAALQRSIYVIVNPAAGRGAARRLRSELAPALDRRGLRYEIAETRAPGDAVDLAFAAARNGADVVAAVGGDGTVHEVANGLLHAAAEGAPAALGIVPVGTGNDFIKVFAGVRTREDAYDALAHGSVRAMDAGLARWQNGEEFFVNAMGTGIDVEVVRQIRRIRNLPGAAVYLLGLIRALTVFRPIAARITIDAADGEVGRGADMRAMMVAVANGRCIGGAFQVAPGAQPDDGLLDVVLVDATGLFESVRVAGRILRATHIGHRAVRHHPARRVDIEVPQGAPLFLQLDGELREPEGRRVRVEVLPGALRVVAAATTSPAARTHRTEASMER